MIAMVPVTRRGLRAAMVLRLLPRGARVAVREAEEAMRRLYPAWKNVVSPGEGVVLKAGEVMLECGHPFKGRAGPTKTGAHCKICRFEGDI